MGSMDFDQSSGGTITGQPIAFKVSQRTPVFADFPVAMTAVWGTCVAGDGVLGESASPDGTGAASGVHGIGSVNGVFGETKNKDASGVYGQNDGGGFGVAGSSDDGTGVLGRSVHGVGLSGQTQGSDQNAIFGMNSATGTVPDGLTRPAGNGVWGHTKTERGSGVCGSVEPGLSKAAGVTGIGVIAGQFFGDVIVSGDVKLNGADCAEDFDIAGLEPLPPGTVMVLDPHGLLKPSCEAYDKKVVGVLSGAGDYKPGIVLDRRESANTRMSLALLGKVYCRVDADLGSIEVGDLLTTSPTMGCAMKVSVPDRAFGSVIGKALRPLEKGLGLIPVLVALQ